MLYVRKYVIYNNTQETPLFILRLSIGFVDYKCDELSMARIVTDERTEKIEYFQLHTN